MPQLDASLIGGFQPITPPDPINQLTKYLQISGLQGQNQLQQMQVAQQQRTSDEQNRLSQFLQDPTNQALDPNTLRSKLGQFGQTGLTLAGKMVETQAKLAEANKNTAQAGNYTSEVQQRSQQAAGSLAGALAQKPDLSYQDVQIAQQKLKGAGLSDGSTFSDIPPTATPDQLRGYFTQFAQATIAPDKQQTLAMEGQKIAETGRHDNVTEANSRAQLGVAQGHLAVAQAGEARQAAAQTNATLNDAALNDAAERLAKGDMSVLQNVGRGAQGGAMIAEIRNRAAAYAQANGISAGDQTANTVNLVGEKSGARALGTRGANLSVAANELDKFSDIAQQASAAVPRSQFVPYNKLAQIVQSGTGSVQQAAFGAANESVINAFAQVAGRGTPTVAGMEHARAMLNTAQTPEQYTAVIKQLKTEAAAANASVGDAQSAQRARMSGAPATSPVPSSTVDALLKKYGG